MKRTTIVSVLLSLLISLSLLAQSAVEPRVLESIRRRMQEQGKVTFSDLYNSPAFDAEEKGFLGRLYEIFFAIPAFLKSELESTGKIPRREQIARSFGISSGSVDLLLAVMEADPRMPDLFEREGKEITALHLDRIEEFVRNRGNVQMLQWEGKPLPPFQVTTLQGEPLASRDLQGTSGLIYFWFTGCPPCVRIAPLLAELDRKYSSEFRMVGLNADRLLGIETTPAEVLQYLRSKGIRFTNAHLDRATHEAFGKVNVYPTLFFFDAQGTIRRHFVNFQNAETLETTIRQLLEK